MSKEYSLDGLTTAQQIRTYVQKAMQENNCTSSEIKEYTYQSNKYDFDYMLRTSQEYLDMLNERNKPQPCKITYVAPML